MATAAKFETKPRSTHARGTHSFAIQLQPPQLKRCTCTDFTGSPLQGSNLPIDVHEDGNEHVEQQQNGSHHVGAKKEESYLGSVPGATSVFSGPSVVRERGRPATQLHVFDTEVTHPRIAAVGLSQPEAGSRKEPPQKMSPVFEILVVALTFWGLFSGSLTFVNPPVHFNKTGRKARSRASDARSNEAKDSTSLPKNAIPIAT